MLKGIDVSHHQNPNRFDWTSLEKEFSFMICRSAYGAENDREFTTFFSKAKAAHLIVGTYVFFRQSQPWEDQFNKMKSQLDAVNYGENEIVPALDIEWNERYDGPVVPSLYNSLAEPMANKIEEVYGSCLIYVPWSFWRALGCPNWVLKHKLWSAHWNVSSPTTPNNIDWCIWQNEVKQIPQYSGYPPQIDCDLANILPIVGNKKVITYTSPFDKIVAAIKEIQDATEELRNSINNTK